MRRVLLDNCLDHRLSEHLPDYRVVHVLELGWDRVGDATLVRLAAGEFDVLVTVDRNMASQINLRGLALAVIVVKVPTNRLKDCLPRVPDLLRVIPLAPTGQFTVI